MGSEVWLIVLVSCLSSLLWSFCLWVFGWCLVDFVMLRGGFMGSCGLLRF